MRTYVERAEDFIKELLEYKGKNTFQKDYGIRGTVGKYQTVHPRRRIEVSSGAARTAIITSDYVIKIDTGRPDMYGGCEQEMKFYDYACDCGMEYLLAKPTLFKYKRMKFYIYPRAKVHASMKRSRNWYGELTYNEQSFVEEICDLHEGNVGFLHGKLCIIDYAMNNHW